jgi:hypothetical protein
MVEPSGEIIEINQESPVEIDVMTMPGDVLMMARIPTLAVIEMREVAYA